MLQSLHVKNLALIEEEELTFGNGFNILTGETGAGKSILLGSIELALGGKASAGLVRKDAEYALVELVFSLNEEEKRKMEELDLPVESDGSVILSRRITSSKSVSRINGETVSLQVLRELSGSLINLYGQHEHQTLLKKSSYLRMLDDYAGKETDELKRKLCMENILLKSLRREFEAMSSDSALREREADLLEFEINEIEKADLKPGEDEELEERFRFLSNVQKLNEVSGRTMGLTDEEGAGGLVGHALSHLKQIEGLDPKAAELVEELSEVEGLLSDFNRSLYSYTETLVFDEEEYSGLSERLDLINRLKAKYGGSVESVRKAMEEKSDALLKLRNHDAYAADLEKKIAERQKEVFAICDKLTKIRKDSAPGLEDKLTQALLSLHFDDVRFSVKIESDHKKVTDTGADDVEFLISLNVGEDLKPMRDVASGGELSRIMLAFKSIFAEKEDVGTLVFDEIDAGISGVTAYKVAEMMEKLSGSCQLICITHLPQIAAMADTHFLIEKHAESGRTTTNIQSLDEEGMISELARLLGADGITEAALSNARELKERAKRS